MVEKEVPWILATDRTPLSQENPGLSEERSLVHCLQGKASVRERNIIRVMPLKWLEAFNVVDPIQVEKIRQRIIAQVRHEEALLAPKKDPPRRIEGFIVDDRHTPNKKERKVFMYASCKEIRWAFLEVFRAFIHRCAECYRLMRQGYKDVPWPAECFKPPIPRLCNAF
jgi:hypothetical protein